MTTDQIATYFGVATGIAASLGALGHALQAVPWAPAEYVGTVLVAVYSNFSAVVKAVTGKTLDERQGARAVAAIKDQSK